VVIAAADHPELEGIDSELVLQPDPYLKRRTGVFVLQHPVFLGVAEGIALVPDLEVRELVFRREERMCLAGALHLGDLHQRFPASAALGVVPGHRLIVDGLRVHDAVADVAVVGDRQDLAAGPLLVVGHERPELLGILAVEGAEGDDLLYPIGAVAKDHDPV
jgi:hypothetical protein